MAEASRTTARGRSVRSDAQHRRPVQARQQGWTDPIGSAAERPALGRCSWPSSMPTGGPPTTCPSARSTCWTTRCCASRCEPEHVKPRLLGHWGTTPGPQLHLRPPEPGHPGLGPGRHLRHRSRPRRPGDRRQRLPGGHLHRGLPEHHARRRGHAQAVPPVLLPRRHPQPRGAGDARLDPRGRRAGLLPGARLRRRLRQPRPAWSAASSATARPRPGRWRRAGTPTSSSTPCATARCCRSCTSTATRSPAPRCWRASPRTSWRRSSRATATSPTSWRATTRQAVHQLMAATLDTVIEEIAAIQRAAREGRSTERPRWPMIVLRTPKGWTGPEGGRRPADGGHLPLPPGAPGARCARTPSTCALLEAWLRSYRPEELFDADGALVPELAALPPRSYRRMSANPHANGGLLLQDLSLPDFRDYAVEVPRPGASTRGGHPRAGHVPARRDAPATRDTFRLFGPDETASNRLGAVFEVTDRTFDGAHHAGRRPPGAATAGSWRSSPSTSARAGWRATCSPAATAC